MHPNDVDFLAILLEELEKQTEPIPKKTLYASLLGTTLQQVKKNFITQIPKTMPYWVKHLLWFFIRFKYNKQQRLLEKKFTKVYRYAMETSLFIEEKSKQSKLLQLSEKGKKWLTDEYAPQKGKIDDSDLQIAYDAIKLCKVLQKESTPLSPDLLMKKALPSPEIPHKVQGVLCELLSAHQASIPDAFERALHMAKEKKWIEQRNKKWSLTKQGEQEGLTYDQTIGLRANS